MLNGHDTQLKMDTGAEVTAITEETFQHLQPSQIFMPSKTLYGPLQCPLNTVGKFPGTLSHQGKSTVQPVFVVNSLKTNLLGLPAITSLELGNPDQFNGKSATFVQQNYYKMFPNVFTGLGNLGVPYDIHLKEGSQIPQIEFHCRYEKNLLKLSST